MLVDAPARVEPAPPEPAPARRRLPGMVAAFALAFAMVVFVADAAPRISMPFGDSHDGRNGAMWASGARSLLDRGPIRSRLGALAPEREPYAHHPPGIYLETAAARAVGGDSPAVLRAPAYLSSLIALGLLRWLLRTMGRSEIATFVGLALAAGSPMFLLYAPMLNHEALSLPFAVSALLVVARAQLGKRDPRWVGFVVGLGGALLSWEGVMLGAAIVAAQYAATRRGRSLGRTVRSMSLGWIGGLALSVAWLGWANGGLAEMWAAFDRRAASHGFGAGDFVTSQSVYLRWGFPGWSLAIGGIGIVLACRSGRHALIARLMVSVPFVYTVVFLSGSYYHSYWNFWLVVTLAIAAAAVVDRIAADRVVARAGIGALAAAALLVGPHINGPMRQSFVDGGRAGVVARDALAQPDGNETLLVWPAVGEPAWWLDYYGGAQHRVLADRAAVDDAAVLDGDQLVVVRKDVTDREVAGEFDRLRPLAVAADGNYLVITARRLDDALALTSVR